MNESKRFFQSADGSTRCRFCSLFPDTCTCEPANPMHEVLAQIGWRTREVAHEDCLNCRCQPEERCKS